MARRPEGLELSERVGERLVTGQRGHGEDFDGEWGRSHRRL